MKKIRYKVEVEITGQDADKKDISKTIQDYFENPEPLIARKEAINRLFSYLDVMKQAKVLGQPIYFDFMEYFNDKSIVEYKLPNFHLLICYQDKENNWTEFDECPLWSKVMLETRDEQLEELEIELNFYKENNYKYDTPVLMKGEEKTYSILPDSPILYSE
jgi:hypothetical protein